VITFDRKLLVAFGLFLLSSNVWGMDFILGVDQTFSLGLYPEYSDLRKTSTEGMASVYLTPFFSAGPLELNGRFGVGVDKQGEAGFELDTAYVGLELGAGLCRVELGRFKDRIGYAAFFVVADPQLGVDPFKILGSDVAVSVAGADMARISLALGNAQIRLGVIPFRPDMPKLDTSPPWFPRGIFPQSVSFLGFTYFLRDVIQDEEDALTWNVKDMGFLADFRIPIADADVYASFYHGWDREALFVPSLKLDAPEYDIILGFQRRKVISVASGFEALVGDARIWSELGYDDQRAYLIEGTVLPLDEVALVQSSTLRYTFGIAYTFPWASTTAFVEFGDRLLLDIDEKAVPSMPPLVSGLMGGLMAKFLDGQLVPSVLLLASPLRSTSSFISEPGFACVFNIKLAPSLEQEFSVSLPLFWGGASATASDIPGIFKDTKYLVLKVLLRL